MPKRRVTAKSKAAQEKWRALGSLTRHERAQREGKLSWSRPRMSKSGGPIASRGFAKSGRTSKIRGKAAIHHTASNFTIAPGVAAILAGKAPTVSLKEFAPSTIRGDVVQTRGTPYRKPRKKVWPGTDKGGKKGHTPSFKGVQLTKKSKASKLKGWGTP